MSVKPMDIVKLPKPLGFATGQDPVVLNPIDAVQLRGVMLNTVWGRDVLVSNGRTEARHVEFDFQAEAGYYEIWVEYAAAESRPLSIQIDQYPLLSRAVSKITGGWYPADQIWHRESSLIITDGKHSLALRSESAIPHIRRIALLPIEQAILAELEMATIERRAGERACRLEQSELSKLISNVTPGIRQLLSLRRSPDTVISWLEGITSAISRDIRFPQERVGFSGPFNGQMRRQELFNRLDLLFQFDALVETGAYLGTTTEMLAGLGRPVFSCELFRETYLRCATRLAHFSNLTLYNADSRDFLRRVLEPFAGWKMPFFYLDAHWGTDLPLAEEVRLIAEHCTNFVVFVDDFKHPDTGYGYDQYESGLELDINYVRTNLSSVSRLRYLFPTAPSETETGARRGTLVIVPDTLFEVFLVTEPLVTLA